MARKSAVYNFDTSVILGGDSYLLSSARLNYQENAIPTVIIVVDPAHKPGDSTFEATSASLSAITKWHNKLQKLALDKEYGSVQIQATPQDEDGDPMGFILSNWIITGAGIVSATAGGNFSLEVELQHPIVECDYCSMHLGNFTQELDISVADLGNTQADMVTALVRGIKKYGDSKTSEFPAKFGCGGEGLPDLKNQIIRFKNTLLAAAKVLDANLVWDASSKECNYNLWPGTGCIDTEYVMLSIVDFIVGASEYTLWDMLVQSFCPQWGVSIKPADASRLIMSPYTPWAKSTLTIDSSDIADIAFPSVDPAPIAGVYAQHSTPASCFDITSLGGSSLPDEAFNVTGIPYYPSDELKGRSVRYEAPNWLKSAAVREANKKRSVKKGENTKTIYDMPGYPDTTSLKQKDYDKLPSIQNYGGMLYRAAKQYFLTLFRKEVRVTLLTRLVDSEEGGKDPGFIAPGKVCTVAASGDTKAFEFYITQVEHNIDCRAGTVSTQISGCYARPSGGFFGIIESGTCNPLYGSKIVATSSPQYFGDTGFDASGIA